MTHRYDFLVIGSGIAGMSFALKAAARGRVALVCKTSLDEANTALAQGWRRRLRLDRNCRPAPLHPCARRQQAETQR